MTMKTALICLLALAMASCTTILMRANQPALSTTVCPS